MALPLIICMDASKYLLFLGPVTAAPLLLRWSFSVLSLIKYSAVVWSKISKKSPALSEKSSKNTKAMSTTMLSTVTFFMARRKLLIVRVMTLIFPRWRSQSQLLYTWFTLAGSGGSAIESCRRRAPAREWSWRYPFTGGYLRNLEKRWKEIERSWLCFRPCQVALEDKILENIILPLIYG